MKVRCYHCGAWQNYNPRNGRIPPDAKKPCVNCGRKFKIEEQDIKVPEEDMDDIPRLLNLKFDKRIPIILQLIEFMQENHIVNAELVKNTLHISKSQTYRLLRDLVKFGILIQSDQHNFYDRRNKFFILKPGYEDKFLNVQNTRKLPDKLEIHYIRGKIKLTAQPDHADLCRRLNENHIENNSYRMRGGWMRTIIKPHLANWQSIEVNQDTIILNFRGHILTSNPKATLRDIERYDLEAVVVFLSALGLHIENRLIDASAHFAFVGISLKPSELQLYNQFWVDRSKNAPELETRQIDPAIDLLAFSQAIKKTKKNIYFRFWDRQRRPFLNALKIWESGGLSFTELKGRVMQSSEFRSNYEQIKRRLQQ